MNTPICDFVKRYSESDFLRLHMPGHKGKSLLGFEACDITEISGADSLYEPCGIIAESEKNASELFGCDTFYSAEGSSLSIRTMLFLAVSHAEKCGKRPVILAGRNAHKVFINTAAILDFDVEWIYGSGDEGYLSCRINPAELDKMLCETQGCAVYITSPDYLGTIADIKSISEVCRKHGCLLLVDNAHGAYLKFLEQSRHPIDLGADICCDSAHKTLPSLTGGAYLHISKKLPPFFKDNAKRAMALFGSTSPSYLILQSLDAVNKYISEGYSRKLGNFVYKLSKLKKALSDKGFEFWGDEPLKLTVATKAYGYNGCDFAAELRSRNIECEFCDPDFVVLMFTPEISDSEFEKIFEVFCNIRRRATVKALPPEYFKPKKVLNSREAVFSDTEILQVEQSVGRILADLSVCCPPAVPILMCGELIEDWSVKYFKYYGIESIYVVK